LNIRLGLASAAGKEDNPQTICLQQIAEAVLTDAGERR
jgi:hypothetical protein